MIVLTGPRAGADLAEEAAEAARESPKGLGAEDWFELGCDLDTHHPDPARDAYRRALELDPAYADAHSNLAQLYEERARPRLALKHLQVHRRLMGEG